MVAWYVIVKEDAIPAGNNCQIIRLCYNLPALSHPSSMAEHSLRKREVKGSTPLGGSLFYLGGDKAQNSRFYP